MRRLRIISGGDSRSTSVVDAETGLEIEGVTAVTWSCTVDGGLATATITVLGVEIQAEAEQVASEPIIQPDYSLGGGPDSGLAGLIRRWREARA